MGIVFTKSANGEATCLYNSIRLHSAYNPSQEALRFVQTIQCDFSPQYILVTGAALSYCAPFLRKAFPNTKILALQYTSDFSVCDKLWDKSFCYNPDSSSISLSELLYNYMGEEGLVSCLFVSWKPSEKAFQKEYEKSWFEIKKAIIKSRNVLATRSYFAKRWVKNAIKFCLFANKTCYFQKGTMPVLVCASGPSLKSSIPYIKKNREKFFLLSVSSALKPLVENGIKPDLCISTDGGYWAKTHISFAAKHNPEIPLALSLESAVYSSVLQDVPVTILSYGDGIAQDFIKTFSFGTTYSYRNGTVSGTASQLALSLTDGNVYMAGLDLSPSKGFVHTQPNELELIARKKDDKINNAESRIYPSSFYSPSLEIYKNWFASSNFGGRLFRLSDNFQFSNNLGDIKDVNWDFFEKTETNTQILVPQCFHSQIKLSKDDRLALIKKTIEENINNVEWIKEAVPADYIVYSRSIGMKKEDEAAKKMQIDFSQFIKTLKDEIK